MYSLLYDVWFFGSYLWILSSKLLYNYHNCFCIVCNVCFYHVNILEIIIRLFSVYLISIIFINFMKILLELACA